MAQSDSADCSKTVISSGVAGRTDSLEPTVPSGTPFDLRKARSSRSHDSLQSCIACLVALASNARVPRPSTSNVNTLEKTVFIFPFTSARSSHGRGIGRFFGNGILAAARHVSAVRLFGNALTGTVPEIELYTTYIRLFSGRRCANQSAIIGLAAIRRQLVASSESN